MSCEMRSTITAYPLGSASFTPPTCTNSARIPSSSIELMRSTNAPGNVFSIPNSTPIFFIALVLSPLLSALCLFTDTPEPSASTPANHDVHYLPIHPAAPECPSRASLRPAFHCHSSIDRARQSPAHTYAAASGPDARGRSNWADNPAAG